MAANNRTHRVLNKDRFFLLRFLQHKLLELLDVLRSLSRANDHIRIVLGKLCLLSKEFSQLLQTFLPATGNALDLQSSVNRDEQQRLHI